MTSRSEHFTPGFEEETCYKLAIDNDMEEKLYRKPCLTIQIPSPSDKFENEKNVPLKKLKKIVMYPENMNINTNIIHVKPTFTRPVLSRATSVLTRPLLISIEGNIGAGKSSLMKTLQNKYKNRSDIVFILEPVDLWETVKDSADGKNILQKYYENPVKYAFAFQVLAFTTRLQLIKQVISKVTNECKVVLMERSLDADRHIFAKMLLMDNILEPVEFQIYEKMASAELNEYSVDKIIWLNTSVEECINRIHIRGRVGEESISEEYLRKCDGFHQEWLQKNSDVFILKEKEQNDILQNFSSEYKSSRIDIDTGEKRKLDVVSSMINAERLDDLEMYLFH
jgi:deoxyadenosine/deoxycytidine kinase